MLKISASESDILNLTFARAEADVLDEKRLMQELLDKRVDICRLRVSYDDPESFAKLTSIGIPFMLTSVLYQNSAPITDNTSAQINKDITYERVQGNEMDLFGDVVEQAMGNETGKKYRSPLFDALVTPEKEMDALVAYAKSFNTELDNSKMAWLIRYKGEVAGFDVVERVDEGIRGILIGVLPEYRSIGVGFETYNRIIIGSLIPEAIGGHFINDVQVQNIPSLKGAFRSGMLPQKGYMNYTLISLFGKSSKEEINNPLGEGQLIEGEAQRSLCYSFPQLSRLQKESVSFQYFKKNTETYTISLPINSDSLKLALVKGFDATKELSSLAYLRYT